MDRMNKNISKELIRRICMTVVLILVLSGLISSISINAYAAGPAQVTLTVNQVFNSADITGSQDKTLTYSLVPKSASHPMPEGSSREGYIFDVSGTKAAKVGPITFNSPGEYSYELRGKHRPGNGVNNNNRVYRIEVYISTDLAAATVVYTEGNTKTSEISFEYDHEKITTKPGITTNPEVKKTKGDVSPGNSGGYVKGNMPKTGDDMNIDLLIIMLLTACILGSIFILYLIAGKKHRKE